MADEPQNLILEHLRAIRSDIAAVRATQAEHGTWLVNLTRMTAGLRRDLAVDAESIADLRAEMNRLSERVDRIDRRLELMD